MYKVINHFYVSWKIQKDHLCAFLKVACPKIHAYFHENFENIFKSKILYSEQKK
jgi:hypothetical protein